MYGARVKVALGAAAGVAALLLSGCGGGSSSSPATAPTPGVAATVPVVVVFNDVLGQSCEALTGNFQTLHTGAEITLEDSSSRVVGRAHLGKPPAATAVPAGLCAWGAEIKARVEKGQMYTVRVGGRWSKRASATEILASGKRLVIVAK